MERTFRRLNIEPTGWVKIQTDQEIYRANNEIADTVEITTEDITETIKILKSNKPAGNDGIISEMVK